MKYFFCFLLLLSSTVTFGQYELKGTVRGYDGQPLKVAHVFLFETNRDTVAWTAVGQDGTFTLTYPVNKTYTFRITGLHHKAYYGSIYPASETSQTVDIKLGTFNYAPDGTDVMITGDFNQYSTVDGTIKNKISEGKVNAVLPHTHTGYVVIGAVPRAGIAGFGDEYKLNRVDMGGDGYTAIAKNGVAQIELLKMPTPGLPPVVKYSNSIVDAMNQIQSEIRKREQQYLSRAMNAVSGGKFDQSAFEPIDLTIEYAALEERINNTAERIEKHLLLVQYLALEGVKTKFKVGNRNNNDENKFSFFKGGPKREFVLMALKEISPLSPLWNATRELIKAPLNAYPDALESLKPFYDTLLNYSADDYLKAAILESMAAASFANRDADGAKNYFGRLRSEYPQSAGIEMLKRIYNIRDDNKDIKTVPYFSVPFVEDPAKKLTHETLKGKYYILDFWSTGCGGCIIKMPQLHEVYEKFKDKNFEIVSVALNTSLQTTKDFRKKRYPMPWINVQPEDIFSSGIAKSFSVEYLPRTFLISPDGRIIASDGDLKGEQLEKTLRKYIK